MARTDGGTRFCSGRAVPRRVAEKGSRIYVVCCIHGWSALFWAHSKGGGSTKDVEYRTVSGRVVYYRENVIRSLEGMGTKRFVLSVDDDTEFRSRCE